MSLDNVKFFAQFCGNTSWKDKKIVNIAKFQKAFPHLGLPDMSQISEVVQLQTFFNMLNVNLTSLWAGCKAFGELKLYDLNNS